LSVPKKFTLKDLDLLRVICLLSAHFLNKKKRVHWSLLELEQIVHETGPKSKQVYVALWNTTLNLKTNMVSCSMNCKQTNTFISWTTAQLSTNSWSLNTIPTVANRKGYCCNLSVGMAMNRAFIAMNRMRTKNSTHIYMSWTSNNGLIAVHDLYCCLMTQCEALHTCCSGFPITTQWYCSQIKLNFHFRTKDLHINLKFKLQIGIQFLWGIWCCNTNCIKCCSWSVKCSASFLVHVGVIKLVLGTVLPTWGEKLTVTKQFNIFG